MPNQPKLQRWTDLLAALLRHQRHGVSFQRLRQEVPGYFGAEAAEPSLMRMFERDKEELRQAGIPIEAVEDDEGNLSLYRLPAKSFYLPFLELSGATPTSADKRAEGYGSLDRLVFEPEQLAAIGRGVQRLIQLGDSALAHEARMAVRKLSHDLPLEQFLTNNELVISEPALDSKLFDQLAQAIQNRKGVQFRYHSINRDAIEQRSVHPYGLAHIVGQWYLFAFDTKAEGIRQFRLRRISELKVNPKPATADFDEPTDFDLWTHTRSRLAWDIGDAEAIEVRVRFHGSSGVVSAAQRLGNPVNDSATDRVFRVRRPDSFLRWVLGFAGAASIIEPPQLVAEYQALIRETLAVYGTAEAK